MLSCQVSEEKSNPHSVIRERGEFAPHMWSQSLYIVSCLLQEVRITKRNVIKMLKQRIEPDNESKSDEKQKQFTSKKWASTCTVCIKYL